MIVEADRKSGAMITADFAADQGREVLAVPGSILNPVSAGCHACCVTGRISSRGWGDILTALQLGGEMEREQSVMHTATPAAVQTENGASPRTRRRDRVGAMLRALSDEPQHIDDLCRESGLAISDVNVLLVQLQLAGAIRAGRAADVRAGITAARTTEHARCRILHWACSVIRLPPHGGGKRRRGRAVVRHPVPVRRSARCPHHPQVHGGAEPGRDATAATTPPRHRAHPRYRRHPARRVVGERPTRRALRVRGRHP